MRILKFERRSRPALSTGRDGSEYSIHPKKFECGCLRTSSSLDRSQLDYLPIGIAAIGLFQLLLMNLLIQSKTAHITYYYAG
jgi:hypothetical protein